MADPPQQDAQQKHIWNAVLMSCKATPYNSHLLHGKANNNQLLSKQLQGLLAVVK